VRVRLPQGCRLRPLDAADAPELQALIEANREQLACWLGWAAGQTIDDTQDFLRRSGEQAAAGDGFQMAIVCEERIAGVVGYREVEWRRRSTSLGYWLDASHQGNGTMTEAVRTLVDHAFGVWRLDRVEIRAAVANRRSRAIPERLGFRLERTLPAAEVIAGREVDSVVYAILQTEWPAG
jgi:ribosomal-protein-serine acetyltransferase